MRTTSLVAAAALLAVGAATSMAQSVYSLNVVGYVNVTAPTGYSMVNNPLVPADNTIAEVLKDDQNGGTVPAGSTIFAFVAGSYVGNFNDEFGGGWGVPGQTLANGQGFFFQNNSGSPAVITFVGEVPHGALNNPLNAGYNMVGSQVPQAAFLDDLGLASADGDFVFRFKAGSYVGYTKDEFGGGWASLDGPDGVEWDSTKGPKLNVGEAMFYNQAGLGGGPATWTRNFTVAP